MIWRFPITPFGSTEIRVPPVFSVLSAGMGCNGEGLCVWIDVNDSQLASERVTVTAVGTGHDAPMARRYVGTVVDTEEHYVHHVYADRVSS